MRGQDHEYGRMTNLLGYTLYGIGQNGRTHKHDTQNTRQQQIVEDY